MKTLLQQEAIAMQNKLAVVLAAFLLAPGLKLARAADQKTFPTPNAAVATLVAAVKARSTDEVFTILGPELKGYITTRDKTQNEIDRQLFLNESKIVKFEEGEHSNTMIAILGTIEWPFPAPLVKTSSGWKFDGKAALREIQDRQIGRNELAVIAACQAYVDAQIEYFSQARQNDGYLQFAQKINSSPGKFDGLYWSNANGEEVSPIGPFAAQAAWVELKTSEEQVPLSGYYFKVLTDQGDSAVGGTRSYLVDGRMIAGFALVAWPAEYRVTGVATMIVNQLGIVYQRDLGPDTAQIARAMNQFDPDHTWTKID
jgi:hypothetical protein